MTCNSCDDEKGTKLDVSIANKTYIYIYYLFINEVNRIMNQNAL